MARCKSCSAPLLANTNRCRYCNVRNDVDLHAKHDFSVHEKLSDRICPHCEKPLQTIQIQLDKAVHIERCADCFGLFFDLGEMEALLNHSVSHVIAINQAHIDNINTDRYRQKQLVRYIKCPVCQAFMRRANYAKKSGVIVDSCRLHGFWLDSGEVTHLMEWKKAGGQLLHEQEAQKKTAKVSRKQPRSIDSSRQPILQRENPGKETDLLDVLSYVARKLW
ncbi:MAG: hypothetical protein GQ583_12050 [Methyloprofundus sp.]|nr:hypothetical protein [Methyloprofundus sp.]